MDLYNLHVQIFVRKQCVFWKRWQVIQWETNTQKTQATPKNTVKPKGSLF